MTGPSEGEKTDELPIETYDFVHSAAEDAAYRGSSLEPHQQPIPNVLHFIYGLDPSGAELPWLVFVAIKAAIATQSPDAVKLHHTHLNTANLYVQQLLALDVQLVHHTRESLFRQDAGLAGLQDWHVAHLADLLRLNVLLEEGGVYLDSDVYCVRSFSAVRHARQDVVLGYEGGNRWGLCNAVILARPGAAFLKRWKASYTDFKTTEWNEHSVILPKRLAEENPDEVARLAPEVLFWPTWTAAHLAYFHQSLSPQQKKAETDRLAEYEGGLWPHQLAYHAWNSLARPYLGRLTADVVKAEDTRFNLLVRRFV